MTLEQSLRKNRQAYQTPDQAVQIKPPEMGGFEPPASLQPPAPSFSGNTEIVFSSEKILAEESTAGLPVHEQLGRMIRIRARRRPELTLQEGPEEI